MAEARILTGIEAARWLRLTDDYAEEGAAQEALLRCVRECGLRPLAGVGKSYRYTIDELERFAAQRTESFQPRRKVAVSP